MGPKVPMALWGTGVFYKKTGPLSLIDPLGSIYSMDPLGLIDPLMGPMDLLSPFGPLNPMSPMAPSSPLVQLKWVKRVSLFQCSSDPLSLLDPFGTM